VTSGPVWLQRLDEPGSAEGPTVAVKDAIDVAGTVTTVGSRAMADAPPAAADAACVAAVRRAGGRIIGKTNLSELCWFADGVNDWTGTPTNPLDPTRVPGGSSSGSAVAVALGEADLALGTDTGGSVRIPAAACGVTALKTTRGRIPLDGVFPLCPGLDTVGPMARDVAGLVTGMTLLEPGFAVDEPRRRPVTVARLRLGDVPVDPVTDDGVDAAVEAAGWHVRDVTVPGWSELVRESGRILAAGAGPAHQHLLERPDLLSSAARDHIERGLRQTPEAVAEARYILAGLGSLLRSALADGADAVVLPTLVGPPPLLAERDELSLTRLTVPFNALGWPALSLPACAPGERGAVPPSVQLAGLPGTEERLLGLGAELERS
jgi:amidase